MGHAATKPDKVSMRNKTSCELKISFLTSYSLESRGTNSGVTTERSSFARLIGISAKWRKWLAVGRENDRGPGESNVCRRICISPSGSVADSPCWTPGMDTFNGSMQTDNSFLSPNIPAGMTWKTERTRLGSVVFVGDGNDSVDSVLGPDLL
jgi:hypothetical protein